MKRILKATTNRLIIVSLLILLQILWMTLVFLRLAAYSRGISIALNLLSLLVVIYIINRKDNPAVKLAWVALILMFPMLGGLLYLYTGNKPPFRRIRKRMGPALEESEKWLIIDPEILEEVAERDPVSASQIRYIQNESGFPACRNSEVDYYDSGEACFPVMLEDLAQAEHYIFLEYFIIEEGKMWDRILSILEEKARQGVDVRILYDDLGSIGKIPWRYPRILQEKGIKCMPFNRYIPIFSVVFNTRDHRKLMVIDGKVAFTGGINMADEYINIKQRFGYWKDNGIRLRGQAVHNMTIMFLQMWNAFSQDKLTYDDYKTPETDLVSSGERGLVLPFSDDPLNREQIGEGMLLNMISTATRYIWFFTPYLIIDNELITAMILAAKRGVDVRIITPGIPDKKIVYLVTQSYYGQLVEEGVKIYQFRPGFIHSKCAVTDDRIATVGTMNLDFRSLYLHFENCVFLYENESVARIRDDMIRTMSQSSLVTPEQCHRTFIVRLLQSLLRIFSPML